MKLRTGAGSLHRIQPSAPSVWRMQTCTKGAVPHLVAGTMSTTTYDAESQLSHLPASLLGHKSQQGSAPYKVLCWSPGATQSSKEHVLLRKKLLSQAPTLPTHEKEAELSTSPTVSYPVCLSA